MGRLARRVRDDERGAGYLAAFIVLFSVLTVAGVGILVDSARILATDRQCSAIALEAARAGANAIDVDAVRAGATAVDPAQAQAAASAAAGAFVSGSGASLVSVVVDGDVVTVRVAATVDLWFPVMRSRTVTQYEPCERRGRTSGEPRSRGERAGRAGRGCRRGHRRRCRCQRPDAPNGDDPHDCAVDAPAHRPGRSHRRSRRGCGRDASGSASRVPRP